MEVPGSSLLSVAIRASDSVGDVVSSDSVCVAGDDEAVAVVREPVARERVSVPMVEEDPRLGVVRERVLLEATVVQAGDEEADVAVCEDVVAGQGQVVRIEQVDAGLVGGQAVPGNAEPVDLAVLGCRDEQAREKVVLQRETAEAAIPSPDDEGAEGELANPPALDRHPVVIVAAASAAESAARRG